ATAAALGARAAVAAAAARDELAARRCAVAARAAAVVAAARSAGVLAGAAAEHRLAAEVDAALRVDLDHLDHDLVARLDDVFHPFDAVRGELRDVDESFLTGQERDE